MSPYAAFIINFTTFNGMGYIQTLSDPFVVFDLVVKIGYMNGMI